ncbi:MAG: hypothetical protein FRX49_07874 [Trebouxia sp. A1-2]|nr:MAG: hypothetical protein FRX49_07874 [Trebouxia sp. A1-2]
MARLHSDIHEGSRVLQRFQDNILAAGATDRVIVLQQSSYVALAGLFSTHLNTFDIVYIDGSHYPQDVLTDAVMAWKLLNEGGIMILDDYEWHQVTQVPVEHTPKKAIDAFLHAFVEAPRLATEGDLALEGMVLSGGLVPDALKGVDRIVRIAPAGIIWQPASNSLKAGEQLRSTGLLPSTTKCQCIRQKGTRQVRPDLHHSLGLSPVGRTATGVAILLLAPHLHKAHSR